jgi:capsule biosynthesis phosphatase
MKSKPTSATPSTIIIDVDGTLCPIKPADARYSDLTPYADMVDRLREYRGRGFRIALYSSRNMRTHAGNIGVINALTAPELVDWLRRWDIPFDELHLGKPWPGESGFYVDDRAVRPAEFLGMSYEELVDRMRRDCPGEPAA